ncbi:MAG: hypothetical protein QOE24_537 [Frankiales bacterium]|jgi:hypothetical protein|nr:hypothetical protein [Frankiales bacterium]
MGMGADNWRRMVEAHFGYLAEHRHIPAALQGYRHVPRSQRPRSRIRKLAVQK